MRLTNGALFLKVNFPSSAASFAILEVLEVVEVVLEVLVLHFFFLKNNCQNKQLGRFSSKN